MSWTYTLFSHTNVRCVKKGLNTSFQHNILMICHLFNVINPKFFLIYLQIRSVCIRLDKTTNKRYDMDI